MRRLLYRYRKDESGATAVEFALVAVPFFFLIIGLFEMAMLFTAQGLVEAATNVAARQIRTGQIQQSGADPETMFRDQLCGFSQALLNCERFQIQVVNMDSFADAEAMEDPEFDEDGNMVGQAFDPGDANDVVLVRVAYRFPIMTPLLAPLMRNDAVGDNARLLMSTIVLQTEPYEFEEGYG